MTSTEIRLVQSSFAQVRPIADEAAELFYQRLFTLDPALRPMFRGNMAEQGRKLMTMLAMVVSGLTRLEQLVPAIEDLGRRHARYGVKASHFETVGEALLWTLAQGLGPAFTSDVHNAWIEAYGTLASVMRDAMANVDADADAA